MLNVQPALSVEQNRFVDDMGAFFGTYGLSHVLGRVFAYLLLRPEPASLDEIAADLGISKSGTSTAARLLDGWQLVRRIPERGSRRIRLEATTSIDRVLEAGLAKMQGFAKTVEEGRGIAEPGRPASRLEDLAGVLRMYVGATEEALRRVREASVA
jgi:DNA-binding MarR family transcriptional regulator